MGLDTNRIVKQRTVTTGSVTLSAIPAAPAAAPVLHLRELGHGPGKSQYSFVRKAIISVTPLRGLVIGPGSGRANSESALSQSSSSLTQRLREVDPDQLLPSRHGVGHSLSTAGREIIPGASVQAGHPAVGAGEGAALDAGQGVAQRHRDLTAGRRRWCSPHRRRGPGRLGVITAAVPQANTSVMSPEAAPFEAPRC